MCQCWLYHWTSLKGLAMTTRKWHESEEVNKMFEIGRVGAGLHHSNPQDPEADVVATMSQCLEGSGYGSVIV